MKLLSKFSLLNLCPRRIILLYHRLRPSDSHCSSNDPGYSPAHRAVSVDLFRSQLEWLDNFANFVGLGKIISSPCPNSWQVAVTFDDGYRDNIELGLPIFEEYKIPMTWFVSTQFVKNSSLLPWWDLIDLICSHVHAVITVQCGKNLRWYDLRKRAGCRRFRREMRAQFITACRSRHKTLREQLERACEEHGRLPKNAFADPGLVRDAASSPWISLGGHTVSHVNMAQQKPAEIQREVKEGRRELRKWTGQSVDWFAYPYGGFAHWDGTAREVVRNCGFRGAVTTVRGYVRDEVDPFTLPRFTVPVTWGMLKFKIAVSALDTVDQLDKAVKFLSPK